MSKYGTDEIKKYANPGDWETWEGPATQEVIYNKFPEFTCLCPRSGYPDFATVHIIQVPTTTVLELKVLKLWLNSFRDVGISHENATSTIASTLFDKLQLAYVFVLMEYQPRGNLLTYPMTTLDRGEGNCMYEVAILKKQLLKKLVDLP